jgi:hypothetical protein
MVACETSRDIIIQNAVRAGVEAKFFAEIQDIRCESRKNDKKDNKKKCFSFIKQNRSSHVQLSSRVYAETIRIKRLVKIFLASQSRQQCRSDPQQGQTSRLPTGVLISKPFKHAWHLFIFSSQVRSSAGSIFYSPAIA